MDGATQQEMSRRQELVKNTREMIKNALPIYDEDETSLMLDFNGFCLQIAFAPLHPLMVFTMVQVVKASVSMKNISRINQMNLTSILGCHALNSEAGYYSYRSTHWLETGITPERFFEILERCYEEAVSAFDQACNWQ